MNKATIKKLKKIQKTISDKIEKRESTFDNRSDKWRESVKGIDYEEETEELHEIVDNVEYLMDTILDYIKR